MELIHGGDIAGFSFQYGRPPLDFSASLNPRGMPPGVEAAALRAVSESTPYPDPLCRRLVGGLAAHLGVPDGWVFCGNGAADIIHRLVLARKPATALIPVPTFAEYERALETVGCALRRHRLEERTGFALDAGILTKITDDLDMLFLCQPNNPTGTLIDPALAADILDRCRATGTLLVMDECFCCFVERPEEHSLLPKVPAYANLFILGSFTKLYGMAGIRLGYGVCADAALIDGLRRSGQPWSVSTIAQEAGLAALAEKEYVGESLRLIHTEKKWLREALRRIGMTVIGSRANYIFFFTECADLHRLLAEYGILIRNCANFQGLGPGYYRVAVRLPDENRRLIRAIAEIVNPGSDPA